MQSAAAHQQEIEHDKMTSIAKMVDQNTGAPHHLTDDASGPAHLVVSLDAMQRAIALANARVVAITSPRITSSASEIARLLARNIAASGVKTLFVDATTPHPNAPTASNWMPGEPLSDKELHLATGNEPDRFTLLITPATRPLYNNLTRLQKTLQQDLRTYGSIVISLPPILEPDIKLVNPISVARAADSVFLVCVTGRTLTSDAEVAATSLKSAGVSIIGTVLDNTEKQLPGPEMTALVSRSWLLPRTLRTRLANWLRTSELFNS